MTMVNPWPTPRFEAKSLAEQWHEAAVRPAEGLSEAQLSRLAALESSTHLTPSQAGEVRALAQLATGPDRQRAMQVFERAVPTPTPKNYPR
jgi:hypothetical protein